MKRIIILIISVIVGAGGVLWIDSEATDFPHNQRADTTSQSSPNPNSRPPAVECVSCHYSTFGFNGLLTNNASLCMICHTTSGDAKGHPFATGDKANPSAGTGTSHSWDAAAINSTYGATTPTQKEMRIRLNSGNIVCSTCHDEHSQSLSTFDPFSNTTYTTGTINATNSGTTIINGNGMTWIGNIQPGWYITFANDTVRSYAIDTVNSNTQLNMMQTLVSTIAAGISYTVGEYNHFQRLANNANLMCEDCHSVRVMNYTRVEGADLTYTANGTRKFSHPVGQALNANSRGYDRTTMPLDVNGTAQTGARGQGNGPGDTNSTNNLVLEATTLYVRCLTCHSVHYTDSNSLTVDGP